MIRTRKLPGSYSDDEIAKIQADAKRLGLSPTDYVRKRLRLPQVKAGPPKGNKNAVGNKGKRGS